MPSILDIGRALKTYRSRYEFLDAFVDDIDEFQPGVLVPSATVLEQGARPTVSVPFEGERLVAQLFPEQGIARFRLGAPAPQSNGVVGAAAGAAIGGLLGTALSSAKNTKEGLLGGLILGMLVGGMAGAATPQPVERVLAMQFDPAASDWRLYDGPLLRWAKRTIQPAAAPLR